MWQSMLQVCRQIYHAAYIFSQGQATRRASLTWLRCPQLSDPVCVHPWLGYIPSLGATPQVPFMGKAKERHSLWHVWKMSTSRPLRIWALTSIWTTRLLQCFVNMYATFMISQLRKMLTRPGTRHSVCHHQPCQSYLSPPQVMPSISTAKGQTIRLQSWGPVLNKTSMHHHLLAWLASGRWGATCHLDDEESSP